MENSLFSTNHKYVAISGTFSLPVRDYTLRSGLSYRKSVWYLSSVRLFALVTGLKFSAICLHRCVPWPFFHLLAKFYGDRPRETPSSEALNARGVAKYSDATFVSLTYL